MTDVDSTPPAAAPAAQPAKANGGPARELAGLVARHKVLSTAGVLLVAVVIAVSLLTTYGGTTTNYPPAPDFTVAALGAPGQVSLSQYTGKPLIVNFWASWCEPCQQETPLLASWYKQQHGKVILLGLDENDTTTAALKFAKSKGVSYTLGFDPNTIAASAFGVDALPQTFFLNAQHKIVLHIVGGVTKADLARGLALMDAS